MSRLRDSFEVMTEDLEREGPIGLPDPRVTAMALREFGNAVRAFDTEVRAIIADGREAYPTADLDSGLREFRTFLTSSDDRTSDQNEADDLVVVRTAEHLRPRGGEQILLERHNFDAVVEATSRHKVVRANFATYGFAVQFRSHVGHLKRLLRDATLGPVKPSD